MYYACMLKKYTAVQLSNIPFCTEFYSDFLKWLQDCAHFLHCGPFLLGQVADRCIGDGQGGDYSIFTGNKAFQHVVGGIPPCRTILFWSELLHLHL